MTQAVDRGRDELQHAEGAVHAAGRAVPANPLGGDHVERTEGETDEGREHDEQRDDPDLTPEQRVSPAAYEGGPGERADQGVRDADRQSFPGTQESPEDGGNERREDEVRRDDLGGDEAFADGLGHVRLEAEGGDEVEKGGPEDGDARREDARGDDRGDRIGGVIQAIAEVEQERDDDDNDDVNEHSAVGLGVFEHDAADRVGDILDPVDARSVRS